MKRWSKMTVTGLLAAVLLATTAARALAALPAPNWMPGFPLVAGPQVIFMFSPVIGAEKYRIYQDGKSVAEVTAFQHMLQLPTEGEHTYYVVAVDKDGKESPPGKTFSYSVRKMESPKNLVFLVRDNKIAIRWDAVKGALVYDVERGAAPEGPFRLIGSTQDIIFLDPNVKAGEKYYYRISAKDASGTNSPNSTPLLAMIEVVATEAAKGPRLKIIKTKLDWQTGDIESITRVLFLQDGLVMAVSPGGGAGPYLVIIKDAGTPQEKRTVIPIPKDLGDIPSSFSGICLSRNGKVWAASYRSSHIFLVDPISATIEQRLEIAPLPNTKIPYVFVDLAEAPNGDLYVTESSNSMVLIIRNGKILARFGKRGQGAGEFISTGTIRILDNNVMVADQALARISYFDFDGKFIRSLGALGGNDPGTFSRLTGIAVDTKNRWVFAGDRATSNIQVFDMQGKFVAMLSNEEGTGIPDTNPVGLDIQGDKILVAYPNANMIQQFRTLGPPVDRVAR